MNKTLSIALAGFSFMIEEHAYMKLSDYLQALRGSLEADEADEVMHDIEIRMVEILKDNLGKREVVNDGDVEKIIAQIGSPEKIEEQEEAYYSENQSKNKEKAYKSYGNYNGQRQLFRDPENQKIGGVCSGLAHYTGLDIRMMRGIWVVAFLLLWVLPGSSMLVVALYLIFWLVLPKAQTASDFLKMKGKPANFDNLKQESAKIIQFANDSTERVGQAFTQSKPYINKAGSGIGNALRFIFGALFALLAISLLIGSFGVFGTFVDGNTSWNISDNLAFYLEDNNLGYLLLAVGFLSVFIPAVIFSLLAIRLLSPKTQLNYTGYILGGLILAWIALVGFFGFNAMKLKSQNEYHGTNEEKENILINTTADSLMVEMKKVNINSNFKSYWDRIYSDKKTIFKKDYPEVDITRKDVAQPYLVVYKRADGYNQPLQMTVPVEVQGNKILLPNYFSYPYASRFRDYGVSYELVVPKTMKVIGDSNVDIDDEADASTMDGKNKNSGISIEKNKININGSTIEYSSNEDSAIVNGKKVPKEEAEKLIKTIDKDIKDIKDINIKINDGKDPEISIKTK